jgi:hypothetical protein
MPSILVTVTDYSAWTFARSCNRTNRCYTVKIFYEGFRIFLFTTVSRPAVGPAKPPGYLGVKRPGRKADHSPPSSAEVKNALSYTSTPQYVFKVWCLVKHRDKFTCTLPLEFWLPREDMWLVRSYKFTCQGMVEFIGWLITAHQTGLIRRV